MVQRVLLTSALPVVVLAVGAHFQVRWSGPQVTLLGSPSGDGATLSFVDPKTGDLAVRNLADGTWKSVAGRPNGSGEFAYFSVFSRSGRNIAYAWHNTEGFYDLRVVPSAAY